MQIINHSAVTSFPKEFAVNPSSITEITDCCVGSCLAFHTTLKTWMELVTVQWSYTNNQCCIRSNACCLYNALFYFHRVQLHNLRPINFGYHDALGFHCLL